MMSKRMRIHFVSSGTPDATAAIERLRARYGQEEIGSAEAVVALGGDGLMLQTLHQAMGRDVVVYGMNFGSVGFMMNPFSEDRLEERLATAQRTRIYPLSMEAIDVAGRRHVALALNEVSVFRSTHQAAKLQIHVDGEIRLDELICDGALVATPAGSTAYNLSAHGPILPLDAKLLALTPISPFRPRRWRGALLANNASVSLMVMEPHKRPVNAVADNKEIVDVVRVDVRQDTVNGVVICFDPGTGLEERILAEQFKF
jgi:NAD+ kinase